MGGLFSGPNVTPTPLPKPKPVRMPTETDPALLEAAKRTREAALRRTGRQSTILTENLAGTTGIGSSGVKLGA